MLFINAVGILEFSFAHTFFFFLTNFSTHCVTFISHFALPHIIRPSVWACSTFNSINHLLHVLFSNTFRTTLTAFLIPDVLSFTLISCWEAYSKLTMFNPKNVRAWTIWMIQSSFASVMIRLLHVFLILSLTHQVTGHCGVSCSPYSH